MTATPFDELINRRNTGSEKWNRYNGRDVIPMWVADMDFRSPPAVIEALQQRIAHGVFGYTSATEELTQVVIDRLERMYGWRVQADWLIWLPGLVCALNACCRAFVEPGEEIITFVPVYPPFLTAPLWSRRQRKTCPLRFYQGRWTIDFEQFEAEISDKTRLLLWCHPHNPVGRAWSRAELEQVAAICHKHNLIVCSDEIHCEIMLDEDKNHIPLATINDDMARRTITLMAPSKTFNIAGLGCSLAIIPDKSLRTAFEQIRRGIVPHVNALGYTAALAAYRDGEPWRQELLAYLRGNRELLYQWVKQQLGPDAMGPVEATFLAWLNVRQLGLENPAAFFERAGVGLWEGGDFGWPGWVRLNFGCPRSMLQEGLQRMTTALNQRR